MSELSRRYTVKLRQFGMIVAEVSAPTRIEADQEIAHYAMMYAQDGPVEIVWPKKRKGERDAK